MSQAHFSEGIWKEYVGSDGEHVALRHVAEIIRCENCIHCERSYDDGAPTCALRLLHKYYTRLDDFCSHAESKEGKQ